MYEEIDSQPSFHQQVPVGKQCVFCDGKLMVTMRGVLVVVVVVMEVVTVVVMVEMVVLVVVV